MKWTFCGRHYSYDRLERAHCKLAVLGERRCGKTSLIETVVTEPIDQTERSPYKLYRTTCEVPGQPGVQMDIWDFPGDVSGVKIPCDIDMILLCIDVSRPETLDALTTKWLRYIRSQFKKQPILVVGCKGDLRNDIETITRLTAKRQITIPISQACFTARLMGAIAYVETSSKKYPSTVRQAFEVAALHHVGKLSKAHMVFQKQRSAEKYRARTTSHSSTPNHHSHKRGPSKPRLPKKKDGRCSIM